MIVLVCSKNSFFRDTKGKLKISRRRKGQLVVWLVLKQGTGNDGTGNGERGMGNL